MKSEPGTRRRLQFALKDVFVAVFWAALSCAAWTMDFRVNISPVLLVLVFAFRLIVPFLAIGALFGRPWTGTVMGFVAIGCYVVFSYCAINYGFVSFP